MLFSELPQELKDYILSFLDQSDYLSVCQVNWEFHERFETEAYRSIHVQAYGPPNARRRPLRLLRTFLSRHDLAESVREISLDVEYDHSKTSGSSNDLEGLVQRWEKDGTLDFEVIARQSYEVCAAAILMLTVNITRLRLSCPRPNGTILTQRARFESFNIVVVGNMISKAQLRLARNGQNTPISHPSHSSLRHLTLINQPEDTHVWTSLKSLHTIDLTQGNRIYLYSIPPPQLRSITLSFDSCGTSMIQQSLIAHMSVPIVRITSVTDAQNTGAWVYIQDFLSIVASEKSFHTFIIDDDPDNLTSVPTTELPPGCPPDPIPILSDIPLLLNFSAACEHIKTLSIPVRILVKSNLHLPPNLETLWLTNVYLDPVDMYLSLTMIINSLTRFLEEPDEGAMPARPRRLRDLNVSFVGPGSSNRCAESTADLELFRDSLRVANEDARKKGFTTLHEWARENNITLTWHLHANRGDSDKRVIRMEDDFDELI